MKKLMIAAATAAIIGGVEAAESGLAQVYDFSATLKTTTCKATKVSSALAKYFYVNPTTGVGSTSVWAGAYDKGQSINLRKQATRKLSGVIWGCLCPTIENPGWGKYGAGPYVGGYIFWDPTADDYLRIRRTAFYWNVLNRIDTMTKVEGAFTLANDVNGQALYLTGAGFGKVKNTGCFTYVPSMSGNLSGFRQPDVDASCKFCSIANCIVAPLCDQCSDANANANNTVAYGTWKIKFNSSAAKKLSKTPYLSQIYTFKKAGNAAAVLDAWEQLVEAGIVQDQIVESDREDLDITQIDDLDSEDDEVKSLGVAEAVKVLVKNETGKAVEQVEESFGGEEFDITEIIDDIIGGSGNES